MSLAISEDSMDVPKDVCKEPLDTVSPLPDMSVIVSEPIIKVGR